MKKGARKARKGGAIMAFVPGGKFILGKAKHEVTLPGFWMDTTPVTVAQYKTYCLAIGKKMPEAPDWGWHDDHPMVNATWNDAQAYASWAGGRLPTSEEFEYAARDGGMSITYPWGETFDTSKVWCSVRKYGDAGKTAPVKRSIRIFTNSLGLSDIGGNVWQWCSDGPDSATRFPCGGSWYCYESDYFRCTHRGKLNPSDASSDGGFRLVQAATPQVRHRNP
ncbi:MAG: SUMF1/EgtB/PvdO family nonheme iron enzyme [Armatimonas sp.]